MRQSLGVLRNSRGFSLIEILLVVIIMGTLTAMVVPRLMGRSEQAKEAAARADINVNLATALKLYELDNGFFPSSSQGLEALTRKPSSEPAPQNWNGPYIEKMSVDPWGRPYQYSSPGVHRPHDYDLHSMGSKAGDEKTDDDITNWQ